LNKFLFNDNKNARAWSMLGSCFSETNNLRAVNCFEKSITINSSYYLAFRGLGNFFLKNKDYKKAEKHYTSAIEINPDRYGPIYKNRAFVRLNQNKNNQAKEDLFLYLEKTPDAEDKKMIEDTLNDL
jgi:tetratricopeptide (TPR) repeat protein